jgi:hypothetical protein
MDRVTTSSIAEITKREVQQYGMPSPFANLISVLDDEQQVYTVVSLNREQKPGKSPWIVMLAQVIGDYIVILEDRTDKPLVDALMVNAGIPRDKIILAYAGETLPDK